MTDSNVIRSTITKQPEPTKFSNLESKAASKDEFFKVAMGSDVGPSDLDYARVTSCCQANTNRRSRALVTMSG
ncbi:hypothetical protein NB592_04645 [Vibrio parahaemolyticus]|uniref:Uncharacterized protein n=1 Tax=Vibrio parahaemolyticus TaxID=670 RepID=A0AA47JEJ0_VIBPH|nr:MULTISPECIES: hypothetical protein [Vibrio harveyi group]APX05578.1 hypothetical protein BWP24_05050 [Vibrio campbellii]MCR9798133.1 hypothetical protein [Vibrio parahaemolyticus]MCR9815425.1 hypothetical protein [Vibrio parahaemolyticus]MCR9907789.1 hypothetical protein [Vibrio campbellii]MDF4314102.1 hypothetical protein [Vibrio parahaemolyticus]